MYFPNLDGRGGLVMAVVFVDLLARHEEKAPRISHRKDPVSSIEVQMEAGMTAKFQINAQPEGAELLFDMSM